MAVTDPYDALLLVSFGGPEGPSEVLPFLRNVTRGRGIPDERLAEVAEHYHALGGRSPINDQCRALLSAIRCDLAVHGADLPVYWGNRNTEPFLDGVVAQMTADGVRRAACFVTSAYSSYSGCRQYRENLFDAVMATAEAPCVDKLRHYFNHPGFVLPFVDTTVAALNTLPARVREGARLTFITHSIPDTMAEASGRSASTAGGAYVRQHLDVAAQVAAGVRETTGTEHGHDLVYCSRSGPPSVSWLEPDVNDHLSTLHTQGVPGVVAVPIGFVSDHMEVAFDLDTEAAQTAVGLELPFARAATPGTDARFVAMVRDLLLERARIERAKGGQDAAIHRSSVGSLPPSWDVCPAGCCANPRQPEQPSLCGQDTLAAIDGART